MTPKPKPFHKLWNKTSLTRVLKAYTTQPHHLYLCQASLEFASLWSEHRQHIRECAQNFHHPCIHSVGYGVLFHLNYKKHPLKDEITANTFRQVRIDFLKHEIKRLTKPKSTSVQ